MAITPYADFAAFKEYLDKLQDTVPEQAKAVQILTRATSIVDGRLSFHFGGYSAASAQRVAGWGTGYLLLPPHEAASVSAVALDDGSVAGVTITDYEEQADGTLYRPATYLLGGAAGPGWGTGYYRVTAAWGYGDPPDSIVEAVLELATNIWRGRDRGLWTETVGVSNNGSQGVGTGGGLRYTGGLPRQMEQVIEDVKRLYRPGSVTL